MANKKAKPSGKREALTRLPAAKAEPRSAGDVPVSYGELLEALKTRIRAAQIKAALAVNRELIALYWHIGRSIVERQRAEGWGKAVVERLSGDLRREFPGVAGFSAGNIWRMRAFYLAWTQEVLILAQPVRELDAEILKHPVSEIPWGHNVDLIQKLNDPAVELGIGCGDSSHDGSAPLAKPRLGHGKYASSRHLFPGIFPCPQCKIRYDFHMGLGYTALVTI
jgi:predicted nuclease of restriction endonuclease-like (RecB) superfamily